MTIQEKLNLWISFLEYENKIQSNNDIVNEWKEFNGGKNIIIIIQAS